MKAFVEQWQHIPFDIIYDCILFFSSIAKSQVEQTQPHTTAFTSLRPIASHPPTFIILPSRHCIASIVRIDTQLLCISHCVSRFAVQRIVLIFESHRHSIRAQITSQPSHASILSNPLHRVIALHHIHCLITKVAQTCARIKSCESVSIRCNGWVGIDPLHHSAASRQHACI